MRKRDFVRDIAGPVMDMIYPRRCPACDDLTPSGKLICPGCAKKMRPVMEPCCMKCGRELAGADAEDNAEYCKECREITHVFDRAYPVFSYRSAAESVYRFKYRGRREYADYYAAAAWRRYGRELRKNGIDMIIPVPLFPAKKRKRGYNQAEVFAKALSRKSGIKTRSDIVVRRVNTAPQKGLDPVNRRFNVKNAFNIKKNDVELKCIMIIDDIYTTGSTVDEVARLLKKNGAKKVFVMTVSAALS